jgi:protein arginine N-methyltransferase 1
MSRQLIGAHADARVRDTHDPWTGLHVWPSVGGYPLYDDLLYGLMARDELRLAPYRSAIGRAAAPSAVDIGTGRDLALAHACIDAGVELVYAIEELDGVYRAAAARAFALGLDDRIAVLHGSSMAVELPGRVDLVVSEIIGSIGSAEGVIPVLDDARRRFLAPGGTMIPHRCVTRVAAASLPDQLHDDPGFSPLAVPYLQALFDLAGGPFDVRLCLPGLSAEHLLSTPGVFEDLRFAEPLHTDEDRELVLRIERPGRLDGLALWINLWCDPDDEPIDALAQTTSWVVVFLPLFHPGAAVGPGDRVRLRCGRRLSDDGTHPDYQVAGTLQRQAGPATAFDLDLPHHGRIFRQNAFYQRLFPR